MEFVFALIGPCSVAWGAGGVWVSKDEPWFADDPFVKDHPEMFSPIPPRVRSTTGREVSQESLAAEPARARGRARG